MIPGATSLASLWYWVPRFDLWFLWNIMAILLFLFDKRTEGPLFLRRWKRCVVSHTKQGYCKAIQMYTIFCTHKGESLRVVELKMVLQYQIFLVRRYFFQTIGRWYFTNTIETSVYTWNSAQILSAEIHLKQYNSFIKKVILIYKKDRALKSGSQAHLTTPPPYGHDLCLSS